MPLNQTWEQWSDEALSGFVSAIELANVDWATHPNGTPWVIIGQRRPQGIEFPHAMVMRWTDQRNDANSMRDNELHRISTSVSVFREGDSTTPQENLQAAKADMNAVRDALYADRSLGGAVDQLTIDQADAFEMETQQGHESIGDVQATITKHAHLSH